MTHIDIPGCETITIYLGGQCNFNCTYCDRDYVQHIGYQKAKVSDVDNVLLFLRRVAVDGAIPVQLIVLQGGEPFMFVKSMDAYMTAIDNEFGTNHRYYIQTNGSLVTKNADFLDKWKHRVYVSVSYDFGFQSTNRTPFDVDAMIELLHTYNIPMHFQCVYPIFEPGAFNHDVISNIVHTYRNIQNKELVLLFLRHYRGKDKFKTFFADADIGLVLQQVVNMLTILHASGIKVTIDGHTDDIIRKSYFNNHKMMVLSPDGLIYPEFDFAEYKYESAAIGRWKQHPVYPVELNRTFDSTPLEYTPCHTCFIKEDCGMRFVYKICEKEPELPKCQQFMVLVRTAVNYNRWIHSQPSLVHLYVETKQNDSI